LPDQRIPPFRIVIAEEQRAGERPRAFWIGPADPAVEAPNIAIWSRNPAHVAFALQNLGGERRISGVRCAFPWRQTASGFSPNRSPICRFEQRMAIACGCGGRQVDFMVAGTGRR
jgi:hypothetical protein